MLFLSGALLFYTAVIVPVQICLWSYDDPCNAFTTLSFDVVVDTFFLVNAAADARPKCPWGLHPPPVCFLVMGQFPDDDRFLSSGFLVSLCW
jgi:hypothetical protein